MNGRPADAPPRDLLYDERLYALFVGERWAPYYRERFARFTANGGRFVPTWNWAAALVPGWLLYRKLWSAAAAWAGLSVLLPIGVLALNTLGLPVGLKTAVAALLASQGVCGNFLVFRRAQRALAEAAAASSTPDARDAAVARRGGAEAAAASSTPDARDAAVARRGGVASAAPWIFYALLLCLPYAALRYQEFAHPPDAAFLAGMNADLGNLRVAQELYFEDHRTFADSVADLPDFAPSSGNIVRITEASGTGWSATIRRVPEPPSGDPHLQGTTKTCGIFVGTATPPLAGLKAGEPECR